MGFKVYPYASIFPCNSERKWTYQFKLFMTNYGLTWIDVFRSILLTQRVTFESSIPYYRWNSYLTELWRHDGILDQEKAGRQIYGQAKQIYSEPWGCNKNLS